MNKNIEIVNTDPALLQWVVKEIDKENTFDTGEELKSGFLNLLDGVTNSLMIEMAEDETLPKGNRIHCAELTIYVNSRRVTRGEEEIILTPKEFDILLFLAKNRGEVFTKEQIYNAVWEEDYLLDDSNIMAFIRKIRKKIEPNPDNPKYILTIWGIGYKFNDRL